MKKRANLILWVFLVTVVVTYGTTIPRTTNGEPVTAKPATFTATRTVCTEMHEKGQDIHPIFCHAAIGFIEVLASASEE